MKKLIIVIHPNIEESVINKQWTQELEKYPDRYTIHNLYKAYPTGDIDVKKEQAIIEAHDAIIFQYPMFWFNCPPLLKKWLDEVFLYGWAYGSKGNKMEHKKIALAISAGIQESDFRKDGKMKVSMEELLSPFRATFLYTKSDFRGSFVLYDSHEVSKSNDLEESAINYIKFLEAI